MVQNWPHAAFCKAVKSEEHDICNATEKVYHGYDYAGIIARCRRDITKFDQTCRTFHKKLNPRPLLGICAELKDLRDGLQRVRTTLSEQRKKVDPENFDNAVSELVGPEIDINALIDLADTIDRLLGVISAAEKQPERARVTVAECDDGLTKIR